MLKRNIQPSAKVHSPPRTRGDPLIRSSVIKLASTFLSTQRNFPLFAHHLFTYRGEGDNALGCESLR